MREWPPHGLHDNCLAYKPEPHLNIGIRWWTRHTLGHQPSFSIRLHSFAMGIANSLEIIFKIFAEIRSGPVALSVSKRANSFSVSLARMTRLTLKMRLGAPKNCTSPLAGISDFDAQVLANKSIFFLPSQIQASNKSAHLQRDRRPNFWLKFRKANEIHSHPPWRS